MADEPNGEGPESAIDPDGVACPTCGKVVSRRGLGMHRNLAHGYRAGDDDKADGARASRGRTRQRLDAPATVDLAEEENRTVESIATLGMYCAAVLPHTGLTLISRAGDRELEVPGQPRPIRKRGMASVLMDYAKRDARVLRALVRFNTFMHAGDAAELVMSLGAAIAVDVRAVPAHLAIPMPGAPEGVEIRPIEALIGDVVQQVEAQFGPPAEDTEHSAPYAVPGAFEGAQV